MTSRLLPAAALLLGFLLTGCATFNDTELGLIRGSGVPPRVYAKMETGRVLTPEDVIDLTRRHVPNRYILRQIDDVGVDYVLTREDYKRLQSAHVSLPVIDALAAASDDFSGRYVPHPHRLYYGDPYPYYGDDYYYGASPYFYGGAVGVGFYRGGGHWHRW